LTGLFLFWYYIVIVFYILNAIQFFDNFITRTDKRTNDRVVAPLSVEKSKAERPTQN